MDPLRAFGVNNFNKIGLVANGLTVLAARYTRECSMTGFAFDRRERQILEEAKNILYRAKRGLQNTMDPSSIDATVSDCATFILYIDMLPKHNIQGLKDEESIERVINEGLEERISSLEQMERGVPKEQIGVDRIKNVMELFRRIGGYAVEQRYLRREEDLLPTEETVVD
jgi:hypothetical protein